MGDDSLGIDPHLLFWVNTFNRISDQGDEESSISITIWVEGAVVTGDLIGYRRYYNRVADLMRTHLDRPMGETESAQFSQMFRDYPGDQPGKDDDLPDATMIHLDKAKIVAGNAILPEGGYVFRCKLASVSGFAWGRTGSAL